MPTITTRAIRGSAFTALAIAGVLGLAACGSSADGAGTTPSSETEETSSSSPESTTEESAPESPAETEASGDGTLCTEEQFNTLSASSGVTLPAGALSSASATFEPAAVLGDLPTTCLITLEAGGQSVSYAVLPGAAATVTAIVANANAAGIQATEAGGAFSASTTDGGLLTGAPVTTVTQETAGFENVADLVFVASITSAG